MDKHGLLDVPGRTLCFPMYDVKTLWAEWMACYTVVLMNGRWSLEMFLDPFSQCPARFPYISLRAVDMGTLVSGR